MIKPTVGRVVLFWPSTSFDRHEFHVNGPQPCAATVAYVWNDEMVNLSVTDHNGRHHAVTSVSLVQDEQAKPEGGRYCEWMPYQKQVAAGAIAPNLHKVPT